jgi:hypothetical protein
LGKKKMMRATGKGLQHKQIKGDNGGNKALPQASIDGSDNSHDNGGQEVEREYAAEKK